MFLCGVINKVSDAPVIITYVNFGDGEEEDQFIYDPLQVLHNRSPFLVKSIYDMCFALDNGTPVNNAIDSVIIELQKLKRSI